MSTSWENLYTHQDISKYSSLEIISLILITYVLQFTDNRRTLTSKLIKINLCLPRYILFFLANFLVEISHCHAPPLKIPSPSSKELLHVANIVCYLNCSFRQVHYLLLHLKPSQFMLELCKGFQMPCLKKMNLSMS